MSPTRSAASERESSRLGERRDMSRPTTIAKARRVPRIKTLRRALSLTQEEFAARYCIPLGTLRDWEQGRSEPDQPARAYLTVIAHDAAHVDKALNSVTPRKNIF